MKKIIITIITTVVVISVFAVQYTAQQGKHKETATTKPAKTECLLQVIVHPDSTVSWAYSLEVLSPEYSEFPHSSEMIIPAGKGQIRIPIDKMFSFNSHIVGKKILRQDFYDKSEGWHKIRLILMNIYECEGRWAEMVISMAEVSSFSDFEEFESPYLVTL